MPTPSDQKSHAVPAQLSFLAIYNPSLGTRDESLRDQIVFYSSASTRARKGRRNPSHHESDAEKAEENEQLRQVGMAQGMVNFAKWVRRLHHHHLSCR
jgi:hypothetical protein